MVSRTNLTCNVEIESWESPESKDRHSGNHLRVATAFYSCVAPSCEDFQGKYAIAVHVGIYWLLLAL